MATVISPIVRSLRPAAVSLLLVVTLSSRQKDVSAMLSEVADSANHRLPMMLDSETEVTSTVALNHVLQYNYRLVRLDAANADGAALKAKLQNQIRDRGCNSPVLRNKLLRKGITVRFAYSDSSNQELFTIGLEPKDCGF